MPYKLKCKLQNMTKHSPQIPQQQVQHSVITKEIINILRPQHMYRSEQPFTSPALGHVPPSTSNCLIFQVTSEPHNLWHSTPCSCLSSKNYSVSCPPRRLASNLGDATDSNTVVRWWHASQCGFEILALNQLWIAAHGVLTVHQKSHDGIGCTTSLQFLHQLAPP